MLKRKNGRILLALLVITGLAGTIHDSSMSMKERKYAITHLKASKERLFTAVQGLSPAQLRYHPNKHTRSIQEYLFFIASNEINFQEQLKSGMLQTANANHRSFLNYNDEEIVCLRNLQILPDHSFNTTSFHKTVDALISFQSTRQHCVRYVRTSTEDLRDHIFETSLGWVDSYQYILSLAAHTYTIADKIEEMRRLPDFPVK